MSLDLLRAAPAPVPTASASTPSRARLPIWPSAYATVLAVADAAVVTLTVAIALQVRYHGLDPVVTPGGPLAGLSLSMLIAAMPAAWVLFLASSRAYESKQLGVGSDEFKRVIGGSLRFAAGLGLASYALHASLSRGFFTALVAVGVTLLLLTRYASRRVLHALRGRGRCLHRVVAVGTRAEVAQLASELARAHYAGLAVVAACLPAEEATASMGVEGDVLPLLGPARGLASRLCEVRADTVAVAGTSALSPEEVRELSWSLEGSGVDLLLAPAITDVAGPRVHIRPVAGLPLLHVDEPAFGGLPAVIKRTFDLLVAFALLVLFAVPMLFIATAITADSRGGVFYRQERIGQAGRPFRMWKFRSMRPGADQHHQQLLEGNQALGPLFKLRDDPRATRVGAWLRRRSLDELPQLFNVLRGQMSLVGPRPPLQREVETYAGHVARRLNVRPGMTGLWQISGRADLAWEEAVRLDLYYVENWSTALDALILWKTLWAVVQGKGAY